MMGESAKIKVEDIYDDLAAKGAFGFRQLPILIRITRVMTPCLCGVIGELACVC